MHVFGQIQFSRSPLTPPEVLSRAYYHRRAANFQRHNSVRGRKRRNVECLCSNNLEIAARTRTKLPKMAEARQDRKAVAVIGSGMAGLVVAYLIQQDKHSRYDVQIFETVIRLFLLYFVRCFFNPLLTYPPLSKIGCRWTLPHTPFPR